MALSINIQHLCNIPGCHRVANQCLCEQCWKGLLKSNAEHGARIAELENLALNKMMEEPKKPIDKPLHI